MWESRRIAGKGRKQTERKKERKKGRKEERKGQSRGEEMKGGENIEESQIMGI